LAPISGLLGHSDFSAQRPTPWTVRDDWTATTTRLQPRPPCARLALGHFATGMYQTSFGALHHRSHRGTTTYSLPAGLRSSTRPAARRAGYSRAMCASWAAGKLVLTEGGGRRLEFHAGRKALRPEQSGRDLKEPTALLRASNLHQNPPAVTKKQRPTRRPPAKVTLPPYLAIIRWPSGLARLSRMQYPRLDTKCRRGARVLKARKVPLLGGGPPRKSTIVFFFGDHGRGMLFVEIFLFRTSCHDSLVGAVAGQTARGINQRGSCQG